MEKNNLIGFYASFYTEDQEEQEKVKSYLWGDDGLKNKLSSIKAQNYGKDFNIILFEFQVNPIPYARKHIKEIGSYRSKEKSIGIPVVIDEDNFFHLNEASRSAYLKNIILSKIELLKPKVKRNKLDIDIHKLKEKIETLL